MIGARRKSSDGAKVMNDMRLARAGRRPLLLASLATLAAVGAVYGVLRPWLHSDGSDEPNPSVVHGSATAAFTAGDSATEPCTALAAPLVVSQAWGSPLPAASSATIRGLTHELRANLGLRKL